MAADIAFRPEPGAPLDRAMLIVGTPTLGLVGAIAAQHIVGALKMPPVARVDSAAFPIFYPVREGKPVPPVRLFAHDAQCGGGVECARLLVLTSEFTPTPSLARAFAGAILRFAKEHATKLVVVPDGVPADPDEHVHEPVGVASDDAGLAFLGAVGVPPMSDGMVGGFSAALLEAAERAGVPLVSLLAQVHPEIPDARAAAGIVRALGPALPNLDLEPETLVKAAEEIEEQVRAMRDRYSRQAEAPEGDTPMFT